MGSKTAVSFANIFMAHIEEGLRRGGAGGGGQHPPPPHFLKNK